MCGEGSARRGEVCWNELLLRIETWEALFTSGSAWSKTHERLRRTLFNWKRQDKMREFSRKPSFFEATYNTKINKQSIIFCQLDAWLLAEGLPTGKRQVNWLHIFVLYVASKKRTSSKIRAFCLVLSNLKGVVFNLLCVFDRYYCHIAQYLILWPGRLQEKTSLFYGVMETEMPPL